MELISIAAAQPGTTDKNGNDVILWVLAKVVDGYALEAVYASDGTLYFSSNSHPVPGVDQGVLAAG